MQKQLKLLLGKKYPPYSNICTASVLKLESNTDIDI